MMTRTEYLFGHPPEKYSHLQDPLAREKIADAEALLAELVPQRVYDPTTNDPYQQLLETRILEVIDAIKLWKKILDDGKD